MEDSLFNNEELEKVFTREIHEGREAEYEAKYGNDEIMSEIEDEERSRGDENERDNLEREILDSMTPEDMLLDSIRDMLTIDQLREMHRVAQNYRSLEEDDDGDEIIDPDDEEALRNIPDETSDADKEYSNFPDDEEEYKSFPPEDEWYGGDDDDGWKKE